MEHLRESFIDVFGIAKPHKYAVFYSSSVMANCVSLKKVDHK